MFCENKFILLAIIFFASFLFKFITNQRVPRIGRNFDDYPDFQQKDRGVQNYEKHCTYLISHKLSQRVLNSLVLSGLVCMQYILTYVFTCILYLEIVYCDKNLIYLLTWTCDFETLYKTLKRNAWKSAILANKFSFICLILFQTQMNINLANVMITTINIENVIVILDKREWIWQSATGSGPHHTRRFRIPQTNKA